MNDFSQKLDLRQGQNLVMTPQLQQAIKLLQLNNAELLEFVEEEIAQNPLLEKKEDDPEPDMPGSEQESSPDKQDADEMQAGFDQAWDNASPDAQENLQDFDPGSAALNTSSSSGGSSGLDSLDKAFDASLSKTETLREHLLEQLHVACEDARDRMIGSMLIDQLDETGYLRHSVEDLVETLGCSEERVSRLLSTMRGFDPTGIFASDLKDCLRLQLIDQDRLDAPMEVLLENLDMLGNHDYSGLAKKCDVNETYLEDMISDIQSLNPKPASNFETLVVQTAIPDVLMKKLPKHLGGGWRVELNTETLPRVLVNQEYYTEVCNASKDKKDKEYITSQLHSANWLVRSLDQRAQTILKVSSEIVEQQDAFFNYGIEFLKPLTLKDIADSIDMHESTVSRVTNNKYMGTPRGIFELKYFFSTSISGTDQGVSHASEAVKARIANLINEENPEQILSDDKIVELLEKDGISLARRTVAKYREELHIPSSIQRRKQKKKKI